MDIETVRVKSGDSYAIINKSDFDPKEHKLFDADSKASIAGGDGLTDEEREMLAELEAKRKVEGNRGQTLGLTLANDGKNPSGTFSEPTPTDIRFPDKDATEFENNHGAFVGKSAAELRDAAGLPDAPGGIKPEEAAAVTGEPLLGASVTIPDEWASHHWQKQVKLAGEISGKTDLNAAEARDIISAEVKRRAG